MVQRHMAGREARRAALSSVAGYQARQESYLGSFGSKIPLCCGEKQCDFGITPC